MSRSSFKISRISDQERETNLPGWLKEFANNQEKKPETAVDAARNRNAQSALQQIVSIMGNPPRYGSVEDAVNDMKERTGLADYLEKVKSAEDGSKKKVNKISEEDLSSFKGMSARELGLYAGEEDLSNYGFGSDIVASITSLKSSVALDPVLDKWVEYASGYIEGSEMKPDSAEKALSNVVKYFEKYVKNAQAAVKAPETLAKYTNILEDIENFIRNNIRNGHALAATVPQLQYDILSVFGLRHGIENKDIMNDEVAKYLSDCILEEQRNLSSEEHNPNIGAGVGRNDVDISDNQDAWAGLLPASH